MIFLVVAEHLVSEAIVTDALDLQLVRVAGGWADDALVVAKLDRLSRSVMDFAGLMDRAQKEEWALIGLDLGVDTTTPAGEAMANVLAAFAQFERRMIGVRLKEAFAAKRARGEQTGPPSQLPAKERKRIRRLRKAGKSYRQIATDLTDRGIPTSQGGARWYPSTVRAAVHSHR
jgi:DNA invertase Pin-like site-specific DNA recombinase